MRAADTVARMLARSLRLARIAGIDVRLDPSLLLFAVLIAWVFGTNFLPRHGVATTVVMAVAATVLFLASVLAHELAHGLEARYRGIRVHGITLFFFGGMTEMRTDSRSARDEFAVSAVGPYASLVCGAVFGLAATFADVLGPALAGPTGDVMGLLAWLNVFLAVFNLVPGAPLDGGRVLRAGLWWLLDDRHRAVRIAARSGQLLAATMAAAGVGMLVVGLGLLPAPTAGPDWLAGLATSPLLGVLLLMIGTFIFQAARGELAQGRMEQLLDQGRVDDVLDAPSPVVDHDRPLDLVEVGPGDRLLPVVAGGRVVGVLSESRVRDLAPAERAARTATEVMEPLEEVREVTPDSSLRTLVDELLDGHDIVVVRAPGGPVAALAERDVARALHRLRRGRGLERPSAPETQGTMP